MSIVMPIDNGQIPTMNTSTEDKKTQAQENKDMFMQLLVAEMQYQDPLEPTDNSQYIQQLYSMSQTESILEVQEDVEEMTTKSLIGKYVTCNDSLNNQQGEGKVDSVAKIDGEWKVSINGEVFSVSSITQVHDADYFNAVTASDNLTEMVGKLPEQENLRLGHKEDLQKAIDLYNNMDEYAKGFLDPKVTAKLTSLVSRMNSLIDASKAEEPEDAEEIAGDTEDKEAVAGATGGSAGAGATTPEGSNTEASVDEPGEEVATPTQ